MKWISRFLSVTTISFSNGRCELLRGKTERSILSDLADELAAVGVEPCEMWIGGNRRVRFSDEIPPELHQRLRNILMRI